MQYFLAQLYSSIITLSQTLCYLHHLLANYKYAYITKEALNAKKEKVIQIQSQVSLPFDQDEITSNLIISFIKHF